MPRRPRHGTAGLVFHVMNRGARQLPLFEHGRDYAGFISVLREAVDRLPIRLLCYVVMPNHWHLVLWPEAPPDLSTFMAWLTVTHARRWHVAHGSVGTGTIYQGRFKAIPVKDDGHFLTVCRYVERNPVRAGLASRVEDWEWSSASRAPSAPRLHPWPVPRPAHWGAHVNGREILLDLWRLRETIRRGAPFGPADWCQATAEHLGWRAGMSPRGRPPLRHQGGET